MARNRGSLETRGQAFAAATRETLLQALAPANQRVVIEGYGMGGEGTSNTQGPGLWRILRQTTAGTASSLTPKKLDPGTAEALQTTGQHSFTAEPTAGDIVRVHTIHPQASLEIRDAYSREIVIPGGGRLGLDAQYPDAQTIDGHLDFEE